VNSSAKRYLVADMAQLAPTACPCGEARRAFGSDPDGLASFHVVEISADARTHYHRTRTEIYFVLEGEGHLELDGDRVELRPGVAVLIRPGCRHRAVRRATAAGDRTGEVGASVTHGTVAGGRGLRIVNVVVPAFDPEDEWFDDEVPAVVDGLEDPT
jgi:quercetin dioxygenase-like cupin family protein